MSERTRKEAFIFLAGFIVTAAMTFSGFPYVSYYLLILYTITAIRCVLALYLIDLIKGAGNELDND